MKCGSAKVKLLFKSFQFSHVRFGTALVVQCMTETEQLQKKREHTIALTSGIP